MRFLAARLDDAGATTLAAERGAPFRVRTRSGMVVPINPCPDPCEPDSPTSLARLCLPRWAVDAAVGTLATFDNEREALRQNRHLSDEGRRAEFVKTGTQPGPLPKALRAIAHVCSDFAKHERETLKSEAERYVVPALQAQSFTEALRDFRIQTNSAALKGDDRGRLIQRIGHAEDVNLLLATLRDPCAWAMPDLQIVATTAWRTLRDRNDPVGRAELDLNLATIEWAKHGLAAVAGNMRMILSIDREEPFDRGQVYELLRDEQSATGKLSAGAEFFGFSQRDAARLELQISRRAAVA